MAKPQPPNRNLTPLAEAIQVFPVPGNNSLFTATIAWDWCGAWAAHGGYLLALLHYTAKSYSLLTNPSSPHPHVLNSHIQFLHPVPPSSSIRLTVRPLNISSRISVLQIELQTSSSSSSPTSAEPPIWKTHTTSILTSTNLTLPLSKNLNLTFPTRPSIPLSQIPNRETDCEELTHPAFFSNVAPCILKFTGWVVKGSYGVDLRLSDRFGRCTKDIWYRRGDGEDWDLESLGVLCDFIDGAPANWSPHRKDLQVGVRFPTLCMTSEIKKDPKGLKWVFMRARSLKIENGRFDSLVYICDEQGDLLAFSKHVSLIIEGKYLTEHSEEVGRVFKL
ncbi:hypothetical protein ONS95_013675 [Cadophora gregata]|uniref:uncharacterized protein n=1 Tax=Cadophora gregata TaxID=51156 RepID=UPI0026DD014E|nr:uncharacterized protein ONS95_013675 [Cadophora gregata]KAK0114175.1 hypothetical protein ONS95_013675 [Cadophora gregata]